MKKFSKRLPYFLLFCLSACLFSCVSTKLRLEKNFAKDGITSLKRNYTGYPKKDIHQAAIEVLKNNNWEITSDGNPIIAKAAGDKRWLEFTAFSKVSPLQNQTEENVCKVTLLITVFDNHIVVDSKGSKIKTDPIFPVRLIRAYCDNLEDAIKPIFMKNISSKK